MGCRLWHAGLQALAMAQGGRALTGDAATPDTLALTWLRSVCVSIAATAAQAGSNVDHLEKGASQVRARAAR